MIKLAVFGGTTEGRHIAEFCNYNNIDCFYFAATEAGKNEVEDLSRIKIHEGRLNMNEMLNAFEECLFDEVIDATHPYAVEVSENIKKACDISSIKYLRVVREDDNSNDFEIVAFKGTLNQIIDCLNGRKGNVLVTTGSKDASLYADVSDFSDRIYLRVLPDEKTIDGLYGMGFKRDHIISGKGPFSVEDNVKALKSTNSVIMVTKESGINGGYYEKLKAAELCGCEVFCIKKPEENGINENEIIKRLKDMVENRAYIIGIGMGSTDFLCGKAKDLISKSDLVIGAERMILSCEKFIRSSAEVFISYNTDDIIAKIYEKDYKNVSVLMSGDTGYFSGAKKLFEKLNERAEIIPGIASLPYMASRIGISWEDTVSLSMHGRKSNLPFAVLTHEKSFVLTDGKADDIVNILKEYNLPDVKVYIGRNLSLEDEEIIQTTPMEYCSDGINNALTSIFIVNEKFENRFRFIGDDEFIRNNTPMTKQAVRNQIVSMFNVKENAVVFDIGSGTGSVSVMMARLVPYGKVYAFDVNEDSIQVLEQNKRKFSSDHIECIVGEAFSSISKNKLPRPDAVFIGGSNGNLKRIVSLFEGLNIKAVISAITVETFTEVLKLIEDGKIKDHSISQIIVNEGSELGKYHIMKPQNPVWIISGII